MRIGERLVEAGFIDKLQLRAGLAQQAQWGRSLGRTLLDMRLITEKQLMPILHDHLGLPMVDLSSVTFNPEALARLGEAFCREHEVLPFDYNARGKFLDVAMAEPQSENLFNLLRVRTRCNIRQFLTGPDALRDAFDRAFGEDVMAMAMQFQLSENLFDFGDDEAELEEEKVRRVDPAVVAGQGRNPTGATPIVAAPAVQTAPGFPSVGAQRPALAPPSTGEHLAPLAAGVMPSAGLDRRVALLEQELLDLRSRLREHEVFQQQLVARLRKAFAQLNEQQAAVQQSSVAPQHAPARELAPQQPRWGEPYQTTEQPAAPVAPPRQPTPHPAAPQPRWGEPYQTADHPVASSAPERPRRVSTSAGIAVGQERPPRSSSRGQPAVGQERPPRSSSRGQPAVGQAAPQRAPRLSPAGGVPAVSPAAAPTGATNAALASPTTGLARARRPEADQVRPLEVGDQAAAAPAMPIFQIAKDAATVVAMDLGNTRSSCAAVINGRVSVLKLPGGDWDMPSVVAFREDGSVMLGKAARRMLASDPENAIGSPKRLLGRRFDEPALAPYLAQLGMHAFAGQQQEVMLESRGRKLAVVEACAHILTLLRMVAEKNLGRSWANHEVILTVPATFDDRQLRALNDAAQKAGLTVLEMLPEPVAAAIGCVSDPGCRGLIAVYDFGGGTFDFSIVDVDAAKMTVVATSGDGWLGGDDFDQALASAAANDFWKKTKVELRDQAHHWQRLLVRAEMAKRVLSVEEEATLRLPGAALTADGEIDLAFAVDREQFAQLSQEIIGRSLTACQEALQARGITTSDLSAVYLSGGTTYIPAVRQAVARFFGQEPRVVAAPEHLVSTGAAVHGALFAQARA